MPSYLERRHRKWYVTLDIPKDLRPKFGGKRRFFKSLKTESRTVADRAKLQVLADWQRQLERARTGNERLELELPRMRAFLSHLDRHFADDEGLADQFVQSLSSLVNSDVPQDALTIARGDRFLLSEFQDRWASRGQVSEATKKAKLQKLKVLTRQFRYADEITIRSLVEWVEGDLVDRQNISSGTLKNYFTVWRDYWSYLQRWQDLTQPSPFAVDVLSDLQRLAKKPTQRLVWEPQEYWQLLEGLDESDHLHSLIQIAAHTGLRKQVLCSLKLEDIQEDRFQLHKSKFETASREFPIHSAIAPVIRRLQDESETGLLFNIPEGQEARFAHTIGERFRVYKNRLGFGDGKVLHSFRHTVATQLHKAQVPDYLVDLLLGWSVKGGSTGLRTYTKADFQQMQEAIEKVTYK